MLIQSLLKSFPELQDRVAACESNDDAKAVGPLSRAATSPVSDGILLIGDASGYLGAITGEGISLATRQTFALGETVGPLLLNSDVNMPTSADLQDYRKAYQEIVRPYYILTSRVLFLTRHPALANRGLSSAPVSSGCVSVIVVDQNGKHPHTAPVIRNRCSTGHRIVRLRTSPGTAVTLQ